MTIPSSMEWIGQVCAMCRRAAGYSLRDVADALGYSSPATISKFEHGHNDSIYILLWYMEYTDLSPWMIRPSFAAMHDVDRITQYLDDLKQYRTDMPYIGRGTGL